MRDGAGSMKRLFPTFLGVSLFLFFIYLTTGFFVIQPIGAVPSGVTIWYWRVGTSLPFIGSADGILLEKVGSVSILGRAVALSKLTEFLIERKIALLPYSETLYLISTGGVILRS